MIERRFDNVKDTTSVVFIKLCPSQISKEKNNNMET